MSNELKPCVIEPLEQRVCFNVYSWIIAVTAGNYPKPSNCVMTQPGGYDPKISLLPFGEK